MKPAKLAVSLSIFAALLSTAAFAHVSFKGEAMPAAALPYNWTGFYAGVNAGIVNHTMNITDNQAASFFATIQQVTNPRLTGGFQIGYRRQLDLSKTSGLYGIELSSNYSNAEFNKQYGSPFALYQLQSQNELKNLCLLQLVGGIAADRVLLFIAAGLSWVNITGSTSSLNGIPFFNSFSVNQKTFGTAFGGGMEYAFSEKLSARFKVDVATPNTYTVSDNVGNGYLIANSITQAVFGVNYKFA